GHHLGFAHGLALDVGDAAHPAGAALELDHLELKTKLVSGRHRAAELHAVDRHEVHHLRFRVIEVVHQEHSAGLRHSLDDQHTGHDRVPREVALEERLVDGDVLDADNSTVGLDLDDPIDQEERVAMRDHLHDLGDI